MVAHLTDAETRRPAPPPMHPALPGAALAASLAIPAAGAAAHLFWGSGTYWLAMIVTAGGAGAALMGLRRSYPHGRFGLCNSLTLLRAAMVAVLASLILSPDRLAQPLAGWQALAIALVALALDGLDGWSARRAGLVSEFGARFDMEVDTALAFVLAVLVALSGKVGIWVVALGLMRPAFVVAGLVWPWLRRPLPPALWRKAVCVVQIGTLTALLAPIVTPPLASLLAGLALIVLGGGFLRDVLWLSQRA